MCCLGGSGGRRRRRRGGIQCRETQCRSSAPTDSLGLGDKMGEGGSKRERGRMGMVSESNTQHTQHTR
eukprot:EC686229.1.p5 GENE.EC686229.1~~EC686229.1.p5  ORF type:complete len:68 (-),score=13.86 EC686229.1:183-386(-)